MHSFCSLTFHKHLKTQHIYIYTYFANTFTFIPALPTHVHLYTSCVQLLTCVIYRHTFSYFIIHVCTRALQYLQTHPIFPFLSNDDKTRTTHSNVNLLYHIHVVKHSWQFYETFIYLHAPQSLVYIHRLKRSTSFTHFFTFPMVIIIRVCINLSSPNVLYERAELHQKLNKHMKYLFLNSYNFE